MVAGASHGPTAPVLFQTYRFSIYRIASTSVNYQKYRYVPEVKVKEKNAY
jgi:hypothetical protein